MASTIKQDEKNEKIIRGLLKLPANKKCINCNSLGPQYVCTNFWTFTCTNCSGIHREFTHRVKSVSMAKFTSQEVTALQEGGNERAKEIFFKDWDLQRHSFPDSSNVDRLRTFIKHVYVDRRYSGDRSTDKPPRMKGDREDVSEHRKPETFRGPRSPSYDDAYDRRYSERRSPGGSSDDRNSRHSYEERRSPGYDQSDYRRSPSYFEVVDDRVRDDRLGKGNQNLRFEDRRISDGSSKTGVKSPNHQKDVGVSSLPTVRPVREILGEDAPALRVGEPLKANGGRVAEAPVQTQRSASSNSIVSSDVNPAEVNSASAVSLIDFDADPEPRAAAAPEISSSQQNTAPPVDNGNWASFDLGPEQKTATPPPPPPPANANSLESSLAQLYVSGNTQPVRNALNLQSFNTDVSPKSGDAWPSALQGTSQSIVQPIVQQSTPHVPGVGQMTVPQPMFPQSTSHTVGANNQSWVSSVGQGVGGPPASGNASQFMSTPVSGANPGVPLQPQPVEPKPNERKELPADLFTFTYPMGGSTYPGWQAQPQYGVGYGMQYPATMMLAAAAGPPPFSQPSISANPFDVSTETTIAHASTMPSMASLPGALSSNMDPSGIIRSSSMGASPSPQWTSQPQPPNSMLPIPGGYTPQIQGHVNQQSPANVFPMGNSVGGDVGNKVAYGLPGMDRNVNAQYSQPSASSFPSGGGNPFG